MIEILCSGLEGQTYSIDNPHKLGTQYGNRTRLSALKGQRPKPIDELSINWWIATESNCYPFRSRPV